MKTYDIENWIVLKPQAPFRVRLWYAMTKRKISVKNLAQKAYIHEQTVYAYFHKGTTPNVLNASYLAKALNVSVDWIMGLTEEGGPE